MTESFVLGLALVLFLGVGAQWLAQKIQMPSILLLLIAGFIAGPVSHVLLPDRLLGNLLFPIVSISVGIILFEGGLSLDLREIHDSRGTIAKLLSIGVLITWILGSVMAWYILEFPIGLSILLGAILTVTGPTVIGPMLRHIRPSGKVGPILKWEGIVIDPIGAMLAVLVFEVLFDDISGSATIWHSVQIVFLSITVGLSIGIAMAGILVFSLYKDRVPESLQNPFTLMMIILGFAISNHIQDESGLLTTTIMGIVLANQKWLNIRHIIEFKETLRTLLISSIFILLAANVQLDALQKIDHRTFYYLLGMILLVRPLSIFLSTIGSNLSLKEKAFLSSLAPRGIVAAAMGSIFAIKLEKVYPNAGNLASTIFFLIVGTIGLYGLFAGPIARLLGLLGKNPQGVLIIGAHYWARKIAILLQSMNIRVLMVDTNTYNVSASQSLGLDVIHGNILDEYVFEKLNLEGIGKLLALTSNDEINALATIRFSDIFGSNEVYQLSPFLADPNVNGGRLNVSLELRGHCLFHRDLTYGKVSEYLQNQATIKKITLSKTNTIEAVQKKYGNRLFPLIIKNINNELGIFNTSQKAQTLNGKTLIALEISK